MTAALRPELDDAGAASGRLRGGQRLASVRRGDGLALGDRAAAAGRHCLAGGRRRLAGVLAGGHAERRVGVVPRCPVRAARVPDSAALALAEGDIVYVRATRIPPITLDAASSAVRTDPSHADVSVG